MFTKCKNAKNTLYKYVFLALNAKYKANFIGDLQFFRNVLGRLEESGFHFQWQTFDSLHIFCFLFGNVRNFVDN